jgi:Asp-tRNA(Asn)/Glu-tRNA(Gln) amidotransferase A subunit family amidase
MPNRQSRREFLAAASAVASLPLVTALSRAAPLDTAEPARSRAGAPDPMDADLLEVTIDKLHGLYDARKYTVTQVTRWHLARIAKYNPVYRAMIHVDAAGALATAARQDAAAKAAPKGGRPPLWGVPIVVKSNTAIKGSITSAGWYGYVIPGLENVAPQDAPIVAKLRAAGAVILGQTNMPDFAASDANYSTAYGRTGNAYDVRYSPGGSSGGTVTAVTANFAVLGTGTDTANSIRMPAATSSVVGVLPTRGLVSITGIQPLDWLRDNTGPIARDVRDAAIALGVMAGEDPKDFRTKGSAAQAESGPYTKYLDRRALSGKRFGVPAFMLASPGASGGGTPLQPDTRALFMKALDGLRAAGATVVFDDDLLDASFVALTRAVNTRPYNAEGTETFLRDFGPPYYHSSSEYARAVGAPMTNLNRGAAAAGAPTPPLASDPDAASNFFEPQRRAVAAYDRVLEQFKLDGLVYPAIQMPPNDEIADLAAGGRSSGPHSNTGWVNVLGVPAISVPAAFYDNGLPFSIEFSARRWRDGDLLGWVFAYEQQVHARKPPVLVAKKPA